MMLFGSLLNGRDRIQVSIGPDYSYYRLYQDKTKAKGDWNFGVAIGIRNIVPNIGLNLKGTRLRYESTPYTYEYLLMNLCTDFDILPFLKSEWLDLSVMTGFGLYLWRGLDNNQVVLLPSGEKMKESDLGFVAGGTLVIKPQRNIGIDVRTAYNYLASSDIYKYGFQDTDDKIWDSGIGIRIFFP